MKLSPATVRNLLQELEEEGLLRHPHTSGGRLPTDQGYRYYVSYILNMQERLIQEQDRIEAEYRHRQEQIDSLLAQTSRILAFLSHKAGFVFQPNVESSQFKRIELVGLEEDRVLMVLVASNGLVRSRILHTGNPVASPSLRHMARWVNDQFRGRNLREFCLEFAQEAEERFLKERQMMEAQLRPLADAVENLDHDFQSQELLLDGAANVLTFPDVSLEPRYFQDVAETLENREEITQIIKREIDKMKPGPDGVSMVIGSESQHPVFRRLSLITKAYETNDHMVGFLGILGPKRMEYGRMVALVNSIQGALQKALAKQAPEGPTAGENPDA